MRWHTLVGGHLARTGTHADALASTRARVGLDPCHQANPWAIFPDYIDRVAPSRVSTLTPKWADRLAAFDLYAWDQ